MTGPGSQIIRDHGVGRKCRRHRLKRNKLAQFPRSAAGLAALLSDYFELPIEVIQFRGRWLPLPNDERTRLGRSGGSQALGQSFTLGCCVYDRQGAFEIRLGPLDLPGYQDFLPGGPSLRALVELAQFYVRKEYTFVVRLLLKDAQVPEWRLGAGFGTRLGWTSWLRTRDVKGGMRGLRLHM